MLRLQLLRRLPLHPAIEQLGMRHELLLRGDAAVVAVMDVDVDVDVAAAVTVIEG